MNLIINFLGTGDEAIFNLNEEREYWSTSSAERCVGCDKAVWVGSRHHCRICGEGHFCDSCAPKNPALGARVCISCEKVEEDSSEGYLDENNLAANTILLTINGCHKSDSGGYIGEISPDLDLVCNKLIRLFGGIVKRQFCTNISKIRKILGNAYGGCIIARQDIEENVVESYSFKDIDNIVLTGFSRGAVSCFAFAKQLYLHQFQFPVYIFANQPVPGNSMSTFRSVVSHYSDLGRFRNIKYCYIAIGAYDKKANNWFHNTFFKQMIPKFHHETEVVIEKFPFKDHFISINNINSKIEKYFYYLLITEFNIEVINYDISEYRNALTSISNYFGKKYYFTNHELDLFIAPGARDYEIIQRDDLLEIDGRDQFVDIMRNLKYDKKDWFTQDDREICASNHCSYKVSRGHRHHCRVCGGGYFCDYCAPQRRYFNNQRICRDCYN